MTFKEVFEWIPQERIWSEKKGFLEKIRRTTTKILGEEKKSWENLKTIEEYTDIRKISPSKKEIITILDACINNDRENINTEDIEETYYEEPEYENYLEKYKENYIILLQWFKDKFLKNTDIIDKYWGEILKHLEAIQNKKELTLCQINVLAEFILKSYKKPYTNISHDEFIGWGIGKREHAILDFIVNN